MARLPPDATPDAHLAPIPDGPEVVRHHGDPRAELAALRDAAGVADVGHHGVLSVEGPDALPMLQNVLSNDLDPLPDGARQPQLLLTDQGKVRGLVHAWRRDPAHVDLLVEAPHVDDVRQGLEAYGRFSDADVVHRSRERALLMVLGPEAAPVVDEALGASVPEGPRLADVPRDGWTVARQGLASPAGQVLLGPAEDAPAVHAALADAAGDVGGGPAGWDAVEAARVLAGVPRAGAEVTTDRLPQEAGLEAAVSFGKGCFVGQETVARLEHRGQAQRHAVRLEVEDPVPAPGDPLEAGDDEVGWVTSATGLGPDPMALGYVRREHAVRGTKLQLGKGVATVAQRAGLDEPGA